MHSMKKFTIYISILYRYTFLLKELPILKLKKQRVFLEKDKHVFNKSFVSNIIIKSLESSTELNKIASDLKINWEGVEENELVKNS